MTDHNDTVVHSARTFKIRLCIEAIQTVRKIRKILKIHKEGKKKVHPEFYSAKANDKYL